MAWFDRGAGGKKIPESEAEKAPDSVKEVVELSSVAMVPEVNPTIKSEVTPRPDEPGLLVGHLYKGSRVTGQLVFQGPARIEGSVEGEIECYGVLTIGEGAEVRAKISGEVVTIRGRVEGNVSAKGKVELLAPARLYGNIDTPRLIITEGVVFDGDCSMGVAKQKVESLV